MTFNASLLNNLTIGGYYLADVDATDTAAVPNPRGYFDNWQVTDFVATVAPGSVQEIFSGATVKAGTGANHTGAISQATETGYGFVQTNNPATGPTLASQGPVPFTILAYDATHVLFSAAGGSVYYLLQDTPFVDASGAPLTTGSALNLNLTSVETTSPSAPTFAPPTNSDGSVAQYTFPDYIHNYDTPVDLSATQVAVLDGSKLQFNADGSISIKEYDGAVSDRTGKSPDTQVTDILVQSNGAGTNNLLFGYTLDYADGSSSPPIEARIVGYDQQSGTFIAQQYPASTFGNNDPGTPSNTYLIFAPGNLAGDLTFNDPQSTGGESDISTATGKPLPVGFTFQQFSTAPNPCFLAGTRIATPDGEVAVEELGAGDPVLVVRGGETRVETLTWVGRRRVSAHGADAAEVLPVRIMRDAVAPGVPSRDLLVSPDHAVLVDGVLIAARQLVNGATIVQDARITEIAYYHLELPRHGILLSEGMTTESYLDTGNRAAFTEVGPLVSLRTRAAAARSRATDACAPLATDGAAVRPVWERLAARAELLGFVADTAATTGDAAITLLADGVALPLVTAEGRVTARVPAGTRAIRVVSRTARPSDAQPWLDDRRRLGVAIGAMALDGTTIDLDGAALGGGWFAVERDGARAWRWTGGDAEILLASDAERVLELTVSGLMAYAIDDTDATRRAA